MTTTIFMKKAILKTPTLTLSLKVTYSFSKNKGKRGHRANMENENGQKYLKE